MAYIPLAMNANTAAHSNVGSGNTATSITQAANVGDKIMVLWPTWSRNGIGTTSSFTSSNLSGCTVGTIRSVYNGQDRHYFCWVTITSSSWSFRMTEHTYLSFGYGTINYYNRQDCTNSGVSKIPTSSITASKINTEFNSGTGNVGLSNYMEGNKVPNTHTNDAVPEYGSVAMSNFGGAAKIATSTQTGGDASLSRLSSITFTAGLTGNTTTTSHEKAGTLYTHNYSSGFSAGNANTVQNGYLAKGNATDKKSSTEGPLVNGFGNRTNYGSANFVRIATSTYTGPNTNSNPQPHDRFQIRLHTDENSSGFHGTGRSSAGSSSGSSSAAGYEQIFLVATDNTVDEYHMWDVDDATITNTTLSGNDYSDMVWTNNATTLQHNQEYFMMFLQWDV